MIFHVLFIAFSFFSGWHTGGKSIFLADAITDPADFMVAPLIGNILVIINKTCCIKDDVVMDMIFINMGADHIFIGHWAVRKTPKDGKEENIRVRVTPEQKQRLVEYAERHYQSMSGVVCQALDLLYAREEQQNNKE